MAPSVGLGTNAEERLSRVYSSSGEGSSMDSFSAGNAGFRKPSPRSRMTLSLFFEVVSQIDSSKRMLSSNIDFVGRKKLTWSTVSCSVHCLKPGLTKRKFWTPSSILENECRKTDVEK